MPRALLSVFDKSGIVELAAGLHRLGWTLISSGGTAATIAAAGVPVTDVADLTGVPAILGHRVVTLHPSVHGGILADTSQPDHVADLDEYGIEPIDLVVVNLYPFEREPSIEQIDIGGPTLVRAAAKNHARVGVLVDPADYGPALAELTELGALTDETRRRLASTAFERIATYDRAIADWFAATRADVDEPAVDEPSVDESSIDEPTVDGPTGDEDAADEVGAAHLHLAADLAQSLRYGENPHQRGARYRLRGQRSWWDAAEQLGGKELSYLNVFDTEAAWRLVNRFEVPACVIVKHANPCGVAIAGDIATAYRLAHEADPVSAFGGIVAVNRRVTDEMATSLAPVFTEVVVAPHFDAEALATLRTKAKLRLLRGAAPAGNALDVRSVDGGLLVQDVDLVSTDRSNWRVVTDGEPSAEQWDDLEFAWVVCAAVSSNAIVLAHHGQAVGIGAGQQNRVDSARIAVTRATGRARGGVCASDAFFPFRDSLDVVAEAGVAAVIQPGGSVRDQESIDAANSLGIAMVFTGQRHFRH